MTRLGIDHGRQHILGGHDHTMRMAYKTHFLDVVIKVPVSYETDAYDDNNRRKEQKPKVSIFHGSPPKGNTAFIFFANVLRKKLTAVADSGLNYYKSMWYKRNLL
jgi:hypothetical protein